MIKKIHQITIKDILILDETKKASHLKVKKWLPFFLIKKKLNKTIGEIYSQIGNKTTTNLNDEYQKLFDYQRLQILQALYNATYSILYLQTQINVYRLLLEKELIEDKNSVEVFKKVKEHTGIDIKTPDDFEKFKKRVQFLKDKFDERYKNDETEEKKDHSLIEIIYSYFHYMNEPYNENMRILAFVSIKNMADRKIMEQKSKDNARF